MKGLKKLWQEFKEFISRGSVVDMAVAVIIGAAFSAIVTSLTNDVIMPLINYAVGGDEGLSGLITMLKVAYMESVNEAGETITVIDMANSIYIDWGKFLNKIVDFLLIAVVLFAIIKVFMSMKNASNNINTRALKQREKLIKKLKKKGMSEEEATVQAEAETKKEEEPEPAPAPTTEQLLLEIRDLLAENKKQDGE